MRHDCLNRIFTCDDMTKRFLSIFVVVALAGNVQSQESLAEGEVFGADASAMTTVPETGGEWQLFGGGLSNPNIGGFLFPHFHAFGAFGDSTADPAELAVGHHDPQREATLQGLEPGLSLRAGMLQGYVNGTGSTDSDGSYSFEFEEGF